MFIINICKGKTLSIIIPHYNSPELLEKLLLTIPVDPSIETIVIDDNSSKDINELDILKQTFNNVIFLTNTTGIKGAGSCRNIGMEKANGKWLLFADSDDYFVPNFLDVIEPYFHENYDVVYFKPKSIYIESSKPAQRHLKYEKLVTDYSKNNNQKNETQLRFTYFVPWSKMINKSLIDLHNIKFDQTLVSNDVMFSTKVGYYSDKVHASKDTIYCVTVNKGSLTKVFNEINFDIRLRVKINYVNFIKKYLPQSQHKYLNLSGRSIIYNAILYKVSIRKFIDTLLTLKKNNIEILNKKYLNPVYIYKEIVPLIKNSIKERKYYVNK